MDIMQVKGRVFDIQRFSIHDGPGIRTIIFLKGCVLRCLWCCNPESQEYDVQTMVVQGKPKIIGKDVTVEEVMDEIKKDMPYYRRSGGGVTLSGGEALCQPEFAVSLLKACKEFGIHTAMESTGYADFEVIKEYLPYLDVYLMDIKHRNNAKHKEFTTRSNELILENAIKIAQAGTNLVIRVPVIPTFNDTEEEIREIAAFAKNLPGVKELHLLPYHRLGQDKYEGLGREYNLAHLEPLSKERMEELLEAAKSSGLICQIGG
ncbi:glycyl-radical enzyme activating protein [Anaerocolumna sp. AGMB13025]|uniref:glycyl-radical enzyme activating protein n=1 Tax=Anaerocolumna sp. AGMB13025 TaxID=3039116 RepID=UPI00241CD205|nr:glycyl-radical enzyme activating protein [Anaerocolumna sp. AGMB13025]WFR55161.1 glycyl-radical enzyme activating protein [Anaerocolumna sp. AGMB13025]